MEPRRIGSARRAWTAGLVAFAAIVWMTSPAIGGEPAGIALVDAVDVRGSTVVLRGETYKLLSSTHFVDEQGRAAELVKLRAKPAGALLVSMKDVDVVRWRATETRSGWVLDELHIVGEMPD